MMEDETLMNISLFVASLGIIILLLLAFYDEIPQKSINDITAKDIDTRIKIYGVIKQIYTGNQSMTLKLEQQCTIDVFVFDKNQNLSVGDSVNVDGVVQEYKGKKEIVANKITYR